MNNYEKLYWLTRLDPIHDAICVIMGLLALAIIGIMIFNTASKMEDDCYGKNEIESRKKMRKKVKKNLYWVLPLLFIFSIASVLFPTKKDAIFIVAGGKTIDFIQKDTSINKIPSQTTALVSEFLEKQIKELEKK